ncbi:uncharacterized protein [Apostichopus japonicus]
MVTCSCGVHSDTPHRQMCHYRLHQNQPNFQFTCPEENCNRIFENILLQAEERTKQNYTACVESLKNDNLPNYLGVQFDSPFNVMKSFHVCGPGLPPCLAHDLFEGVVSYDLHLFLMFFIRSKKWFSIDLLNKRIHDFKYKGKDSFDKPTKVKGNYTSEKLSGHAVQNWNFLRLLPVIIVDKIEDYTDEVWQTVLTLREVVELVCAPKISKKQLQYLQDLIHIYLQSRQRLFPNKRIRPKHHYLLHYPRLITQFGPLMKVWTLRYESKHKYFTRVSSSAKNFKNPTKTLSTRHQFLQAAYSAGQIFAPEVVAKKALKFSVELYSEALSQAFKSCKDLETSTNVDICYEVNLYGTDYVKGQLLVTSCSGKSLEVGELICIFLTNLHHSNVEKTSVYFVLKPNGCLYDAALGCYKLDTKIVDEDLGACKYNIVLAKNVTDYYPLQTYSFNGSPYIVLKHAIMCPSTE